MRNECLKEYITKKQAQARSFAPVYNIIFNLSATEGAYFHFQSALVRYVPKKMQKLEEKIWFELRKKSC